MMLLRVQVKPNAKSDSISMDAAGTIKVKIKAPPVDGKANEYLVKYLAEIFGRPRSAIRLLKGETAKFKTLEIDMEEDRFLKILEKFRAE